MKLINPLVILRILSTILFIESVTYLLCIPVAHLNRESTFPFLWSSLAAILISTLFYLVTKEVDIQRITSKEGILAVTLSWLTLTLCGTFPYLLSGTIPLFYDAFFESASGFSTTGSSILADVEAMPRSILFWRSLTHWIGGLGIIVLVIIVLPSLKVTGYQLMSLESSLKEKIHPRTKAVGYRLLYIYIGLTLTETCFLVLGDMDLFESLCHAFGTVATGGFSTRNAGIASYSTFVQYVIALFMLLSGISYVVYYYILKFNFSKVRHNEELWFYLIVTIITGVILTFIVFSRTNKPFETAFREGFFQAVSLITTTGYSITNYLLWSPAGMIIVFFLLFAGASTGSTTGGIKMARHLIVLKNVRNVFIRLVHPNAVYQIRLNDRPLSENTNISILSFVVMYIFIFAAGTIIIVITGLDIVTAASASATSLGNIGPGLGSIGPMNNFSHFPEITKIVLSLMMIIGRLEIFAVFTIFTRSFWRV
jgi:trk system potassium uptake protein TrkH